MEKLLFNDEQKYKYSTTIYLSGDNNDKIDLIKSKHPKKSRSAIINKIIEKFDLTEYGIMEE